MPRGLLLLVNLHSHFNFHRLFFDVRGKSSLVMQHHSCKYCSLLLHLPAFSGFRVHCVSWLVFSHEILTLHDCQVPGKLCSYRGRWGFSDNLCFKS